METEATYEIIINRVTTRTVLKRGDHTIIDKRPMTEAELADANGPFRAAYEQKPDAFKLKEVYGYAPDREEDEKVEEQIFRQQVEGLDLADVIKAVNKIK